MHDPMTESILSKFNMSTRSDFQSDRSTNETDSTSSKEYQDTESVAPSTSASTDVPARATSTETKQDPTERPATHTVPRSVETHEERHKTKAHSEPLRTSIRLELAEQARLAELQKDKEGWRVVNGDGEEGIAVPQLDENGIYIDVRRPSQ
jgi:hypothetical protein